LEPWERRDSRKGAKAAKHREEEYDSRKVRKGFKRQKTRSNPDCPRTLITRPLPCVAKRSGGGSGWGHVEATASCRTPRMDARFLSNVRLALKWRRAPTRAPSRATSPVNGGGVGNKRRRLTYASPPLRSEAKRGDLPRFAGEV